MGNQITQSARDRLRAILTRLAERLEHHNHERENDRLAGLVQDALNDRGTA